MVYLTRLRRSALFLIPVLFAPISTSVGFSPAKLFPFRRSGRSDAPSGRPLCSTVATEDPEVVLAGPPPSWDELASLLTGDASGEGDEEGGDGPQPVLTLYRDTNGWCPFCERVWLCLEAKGLPYRERLISLFDKPEWFKELVPTALVPAVLLHDEGRSDGDGDESSEDAATPQRRLIWESLDVMKALDDAFPDTPRLVLDTPEYLAAREQMNALSSAGFAFVYSGRNGTLSEEEKAERKNAFEAQLDSLEQSLASHGGPFRLGSDFTGADAEIVPMLERWRYQLPITGGMDISEGRPALRRWFDAMDSFGPYRDRVSGDAYSWAAVSSTFTRYFGGDGDDPKIKETIERADAYAEKLAESFASDVSPEEGLTAAFAKEAAAKLVSNHEAVVADCTRSEPSSQKEIARASDADAADVVLRHVASILLSPDGAVTAAREGPLVEVPEEKREDAALALRTVARRLCVPRDMGTPAARIMRGVLAIVADRLEC